MSRKFREEEKADVIRSVRWSKSSWARVLQAADFFKVPPTTFVRGVVEGYLSNWENMINSRIDQKTKEVIYDKP